MVDVEISQSGLRRKGKLSHEDLFREVGYDPATGIFTKKSNGRTRLAGTVIGTTRKNGHRQLVCCRVTIMASVAAWVLQTGFWPRYSIGCINGDRGDLRWENLKEIKPVAATAGMRPDVDWVRSQLDYNPETGVFFWKVARCGVKIGEPAGSLIAKGYNQIALARKSMRAAIVAWAWMTGSWPDRLIDHIDRNRSNDRWDNLRLATHSQNGGNKSIGSNNSSGFKGVVYIDGYAKPWRAMIGHQGKAMYLGMFHTAEEANAAYVSMAGKVHGEFACAG